MTPKVSIIIPCYKSEKYIRQCVESILAQTFEDWEAIFIIDCCSIDKTEDILNEYWEKIPKGKMTIVSSNAKTSPSIARNSGVSIATGKYIAFLDADDWWYPEKLSKQVHYMDTHPDVQWCWGRATVHTGVKCSDYPVQDWDNLKANEMIPFQTFMLRRELVDEIVKRDGHLLNESLSQIDDYDLYLRLKEYKNYGFREPLSHYRYHCNGLTTGTDTQKVVGMQLAINVQQHHWLNVASLVILWTRVNAGIALRPYYQKYWKHMEDYHRGSFLQIEPTTRCNLVCQKCTRGRDTPIVDITQDTLMALINGHAPVKTILLQGLGEPFMHPNFAFICKLAKDNCRDLIVVTNGTILNQDALQYITHLVVSLDTMDPHFANETRSINYDLNAVKRNIEELAKRDKPTVAVNFVRSAQNYYDRCAVKAFCDEMGIPIHVTPIQNWYNPEEPEWRAAHDNVMAERGLSGKKDKPFSEHCPFLDGRKYYYDARGMRHPCCVRMRYTQVHPTIGTCRTCPE